ncbi:MAG TPA: c-type cytochrome [Chryseolinea sp.]|nr:c-type cytochrome [Chryseolinea sp.]
MKKFLKFLLYALLAVIVLVGAVIIYVKTALPDVGAPEDITIERTPERIERGRYLAHSVSICMDCHSTRDWSKFSGPLTEGTLGKGGERFDHSVGLPGVFISKNITPAGIERYTDGELFRVITTGVSKEGKAMFPLMPFRYYGKMDREDIYAMIAYIRTLEPITNPVPESEPDFPMSVVINTIPQPAEPQTRPDPSDQLAYGHYMASASGCVECHTQVDKGQILPEVAFGGGREFGFPDGSKVRSSNISPDKDSGIGTWTREQFIARFKVYADSSYVAPSIKPGEYNTIMPWTMYAHMTEEDLSAIFTYLQSVSPISNKVTKFTPAPK